MEPFYALGDLCSPALGSARFAPAPGLLCFFCGVVWYRFSGLLFYHRMNARINQLAEHADCTVYEAGYPHLFLPLDVDLLPLTHTLAWEIASKANGSRQL